MKKFTSISVRSIALTLMMFKVVTAVAFAANPVPGINIVVKKIPGGIAMSNTTTNDKGKTTSSKLEKGTYDLEFSNPKATSTTPIFPFMLKLEGAAQVTVNGNVWDSTKQIKVEKGTKIQIVIKATDTTITATTTVCDK